jgi:hypothetical protein
MTCSSTILETRSGLHWLLLHLHYHLQEAILDSLLCLDEPFYLVAPQVANLYLVPFTFERVVRKNTAFPLQVQHF